MTVVRYNRKRDHIRVTMSLAEALEIVSHLQPLWQFRQELNRVVTVAGPRSLAAQCTAAKVHARMRGHKLGEWTYVGDHIRENICLNCGQSVRVNSRPTPNEVDIGGDAVALDCPGKSSRRFQVLKPSDRTPRRAPTVPGRKPAATRRFVGPYKKGTKAPKSPYPAFASS